jgi:hypothetical protein
VRSVRILQTLTDREVNTGTLRLEWHPDPYGEFLKGVYLKSGAWEGFNILADSAGGNITAAGGITDKYCALAGNAAILLNSGSYDTNVTVSTSSLEPRNAYTICAAYAAGLLIGSSWSFETLTSDGYANVAIVRTSASFSNSLKSETVYRIAGDSSTFTVERALTFPQNDATFNHANVVGVMPYNMWVQAPYGTSSTGSNMASLATWPIAAESFRPRTRLLNALSASCYTSNPIGGQDLPEANGTRVEVQYNPAGNNVMDSYPIGMVLLKGSYWEPGWPVNLNLRCNPKNTVNSMQLATRYNCSQSMVGCPTTGSASAGTTIKYSQRFCLYSTDTESPVGLSTACYDQLDAMPTPSFSVTPTVSPSITASVTASMSVSPSMSPSASVSVSSTVSPSESVSMTASATVTVSESVSATVTPSSSVTASITVTTSVSATATPLISNWYRGGLCNGQYQPRQYGTNFTDSIDGSPFFARYVRVTRISATTPLEIIGLAISSDAAANTAHVGKEVKMSSPDSYPAAISRLTDPAMIQGCLDGTAACSVNSPGVATANGDLNPWIEVDLGANTNVLNVTVFPKQIVDGSSSTVIDPNFYGTEVVFFDSSRLCLGRIRLYADDCNKASLKLSVPDSLPAGCISYPSVTATISPTPFPGIDTAGNLLIDIRGRDNKGCGAGRSREYYL